MAEISKKILLVDDDKFLVDMYTLKFKSASFDIMSAFSGEEAIEKIKNGFSPDAVLFDIIMPGLSGLEFLAAIKKENLAPKAVYIVLSNQGQSSDIEEAKKLGIDGYIVKASTIPSEVLEQVREILNRKK
ncbi:MAG: response regulator [Patescibacteria group bacterium]